MLVNLSTQVLQTQIRHSMIGSKFTVADGKSDSRMHCSAKAVVDHGLCISIMGIDVANQVHSCISQRAIYVCHDDGRFIKSAFLDAGQVSILVPQKAETPLTYHVESDSVLTVLYKRDGKQETSWKK